ncbi:hypothetical protein EAE32_03100 [Kocuria tytonicola]|uniref:DUF4878 domain-containing protein n=1 Tax=Kocuria tytonicola TaxID=2055946 RepID=A0A3L9LAU5_9MICC|nr:hypothetical protein [Kocuria tytonicola]RLY94217.1 hypothetical protein EAE32_03100 [Kocuria tytonicola]
MERSDRIVRAVGAWFFLIVLAVAATAVTIALVNKYQYGPETDVREYFQALQDGDGGKALGLLNAGVPDSNAALLDGEALREAGSHLEDVQVSTVSSGGDHAVVRASYLLDGREASSEFSLHPAETQWGFFTVWDFDPSTLPTMTVSMPGSTAVDINGASVALRGSSRDFAVFYPGVYTGSYSSPMISAEPREVAVSDEDQRTTMELTAVPSEQLRQQVEEQVHSHLDACASQDSLYPAGCPFSHDFPGRIQGRVSWRVTDYPAPEPRLGGPHTDQWSLPDSRGTAHIEFTAVDLYDGHTTKVSKDVPFTFSARLAVTGDKATVTPR